VVVKPPDLATKSLVVVRGATGATGPAGPPGSGAAAAYNETPAGSIDGSNMTFTTSAGFASGTTRLYLNGIRQTLGDAYAEAVPDQLLLTFAPEPGDALTVDYVEN
jgi:hypothetical protein